jgi:hypothetical protein
LTVDGGRSETTAIWRVWKPQEALLGGEEDKADGP